MIEAINRIASPLPFGRIGFCASGLTASRGHDRPELQAAAGPVAGRVKDFEERGAKPHATTRARLAKVLRAPGNTALPA